MLTHGNLVANTLQLAAWFAKAERGKEVVMAAIPFFHVYGMTVCMIFGIHIGRGDRHGSAPPARGRRR